MKLTPELLRAATGCEESYADLYAGPLSEACEAHDITTPERLAAFLAQIGHESGGLRYVREGWGPTLAQVRYEGRADLGNTEPGDGFRYRGRGLIQLTGRANYVRIRDRLRGVFPGVPDFEADPEQLERPQWACASAAEYWTGAGLNRLADAGDFESITKRINGGLNGQADRLQRWERAKAALAVADVPITPESVMPAEPEALAITRETAPPTKKGWSMAPILAALLPSLVSAIPRLASIFTPGSPVAERNVKAVTTAFEIAKDALGAANEQEVVQRVQSDPAAAQTVTQAIESRWIELTEAGGGGIEGARKADAEYSSGRADFLHSPSFWVGLALLPLVYMIVANLIGILGSSTWSDDARSALAGSIVGSIIGGLVGYYFGQSTSRNRAPA